MKITKLNELQKQLEADPNDFRAKNLFNRLRNDRNAMESRLKKKLLQTEVKHDLY